jgi:hypothetical protein
MRDGHSNPRVGRYKANYSEHIVHEAMAPMLVGSVLIRVADATDKKRKKKRAPVCGMGLSNTTQHEKNGLAACSPSH